MFSNYVMVAVRNALKNRMHVIINILGLTIGLTGFVFTHILVEYESTHDTFFENADRVYGVYEQQKTQPGTSFAPSLIGVRNAFAPLAEANIPEIERIARFLSFEMVVGEGYDILYRRMQFVDPAFFDIFDLDFISGDAERMDQPGNIVLSRSTALELFNTEDVVGKTLVVSSAHTLQVVGVFQDLPLNSHLEFNLVTDTGFNFVANIDTYENLRDIDTIDVWNNMNTDYKTYVLLPEGTDIDAMSAEMTALAFNAAPSFYADFVEYLGLRPLQEMNNWLFEALNLPAMEGLIILGYVLMGIAILNYMNLAGAKALLRSREVGMRKVAGATKVSLILQFVIEAMLESLVALILAVIAISFIIPVFNDMAGKAVEFDIISDIGMVLWLLAVALGAGAIAGLYPAWVLSRLPTVGALGGIATSGRLGRAISSTMVTLQFTFSITLIVAATITFAQNDYMRTKHPGFNDQNVLAVQRTRDPAVTLISDQLKAQFERIDGVSRVARSRSAPWENSGWGNFYRTEDGGIETKMNFNVYHMDDDFIDLFDIPLLAGRNFSRDIAGDVQIWSDQEDDSDTASESAAASEVREVNVIVSREIVGNLGIASPSAAIGRQFYQVGAEDETQAVLTIVGVVEEANYVGFLFPSLPLVYEFVPQVFGAINIQYDPEKIQHVVSEIDRIWLEAVPTRPIERQFLAEIKEGRQWLYNGIFYGIAGFSALATLVACIGLYALASFLAERRTKEIGIRKVMGASIPNILGRLTWRLALPAAWGCLIGLPLGWFIADLSAQFLTDRVPLSAWFFIGPAAFIIGLAMITVAGHTTRVSVAHPIKALRYE